MGPVTHNPGRRRPPVTGRRFFTVLRRARHWGVIALAFCAINLDVAGAESMDEREYALKAAFLFHFTQFIEWPPEVAPKPGEPIRIGVVEPNPFNGILRAIVEGETINGHPIVVEQREAVEDAEGAHILFIPEAARKSQAEAILRLSQTPILLVGEDPDFVRQGGMIALVRDGARVSIVLSRSALETANLSASSRLLRLAQIIDDS